MFSIDKNVSGCGKLGSKNLTSNWINVGGNLSQITGGDCPKTFNKQPWSHQKIFSLFLFLQISFAFMCVRLVQVVSSSYVPLYLTETLGFEKVIDTFLFLDFIVTVK